MSKFPLRTEERKEGIKEKNLNRKDSTFISISFKYFQGNQLPGQNFDDWDNEKRLLDTFSVLQAITSDNITNIQSSNRVVLYKKFPKSDVNDFDLPKGLKREYNWGTIRNIGGQKARIAGFLEGSVFYIVFLDKNHVFHKTKRKNT